MLTKSFAKTFALPMDPKQLQNEQIKKVLQQLMSCNIFEVIKYLEQQEYINQKIHKNEQTQNKIKRIQDQFILWVDKKNSVFKNKLQKSQKNRNQIIQKIVKKYKDKDKLHHQKLKNVNNKRKQDLRQAWRRANKFNQKILSSSKSFHNPIIQKSHIEQNQIQQNDKLVNNINQTNEQNMRNTAKSQFINKSIHLHKSHQKSPNNHNNRQFQINRKNILTRRQQESKTHTIQQDQFQQQKYNPQNHLQQKMRMNLLRHKQHKSQQENKKIQQLGKRLRKIELYRIKKQSLNKSKIKKNDNQRSLTQSRDRNDQKQKELKKQRLNSQPVSCDRVKRASDWSQSNKKRREQQFLSHIQNGNHYLEQNKIRYLKQILSKTNTYHTVEKKLYIQRLNH